MIVQRVKKHIIKENQIYFKCNLWWVWYISLYSSWWIKTIFSYMMLIQKTKITFTILKKIFKKSILKFFKKIYN